MGGGGSGTRVPAGAARAPARRTRCRCASATAASGSAPSRPPRAPWSAATTAPVARFPAATTPTPQSAPEASSASARQAAPSLISGAAAEPSAKSIKSSARQARPSLRTSCGCLSPACSDAATWPCLCRQRARCSLVISCRASRYTIYPVALGADLPFAILDLRLFSSRTTNPALGKRSVQSTQQMSRSARALARMCRCRNSYARWGATAPTESPPRPAPPAPPPSRAPCTPPTASPKQVNQRQEPGPVIPT